MLDPFSRGAVVTLCALCVAAALALAPIRARSSIDSAHLAGPSAPVGAATAAVPIETVVRDPFAQPTTAAASPARAVPASAPEPQARHFATDGIEPLPSNVGNDVVPVVPGNAPQPEADTVAVTAVVTGAHPYAMVNTRGVHEIKGIGDRVDGSAVVAIDITGIRLQNGIRLAVDPAGQP
jgi:hypothetical protein